MGPIPANMRRCPTMVYCLQRWSNGKPALQIGPTSHKFAGHRPISPEIHLISDRHSLYNIGD